MPPKKIILIEDNANDALYFEECLRQLDRFCAVAHSAEAAMALIHRNHIAVAFVDMRLQTMHGWELIPHIWNQSPDTIVVATCTLMEDVAKVEAHHGLFMVMQKPVTVERLRMFFKLFRV